MSLIVTNAYSFISGTNVIPTHLTLGVDVSHWTGTNDWVRMKTNGVMFGIFKATDFIKATTIGFVDSKAIENWNGTKNAGVINGGYHWLQPRVDPTLQARFYLDKFYSKYPTDLPPILDFEDNDMISTSDYLWRAQIWLDIVEKETGRIPIVYSSPGFMARFDKTKTGFLSKYPLWVAHYIQRTYPTTPAPWANWTMWQYSDRGHYPYYLYGDSGAYGLNWGAGSSRLDMNWFNGTYEDLLAFCKLGNIPVPPPPVEPDKPLFNAQCNVQSLYVRTGPSTSYPAKGSLVYGQIVTVFEEKNGWYRHGEDKWSYGAYLTKINAVPSKPLFKGKCNVDSLRKRALPNTSSAILGYLYFNDIVDVYEVQGDWWKIDPVKSVWVASYNNYMIKL